MIKGINESQGTINFDSSLAKKEKTDASKEILGKDQFLKLLVTQLSKQDPLNPVSDTQFIAQMAQFSSLEQMMKVSQSTEKVFRSLERLEAQGMVGAQVEYQEQGSDQLQQGIVNGISAYSHNLLLKVGEKMINVSDVTSVSTPNITSTTTNSQEKNL